MVNLTLTEQETKLVIELCDMALKNGGLMAVNAVVPLAQKFQQALQAQQSQSNEQTRQGTQPTSPGVDVTTSSRRRR